MYYKFDNICFFGVAYFGEQRSNGHNQKGYNYLASIILGLKIFKSRLICMCFVENDVIEIFRRNIRHCGCCTLFYGIITYTQIFFTLATVAGMSLPM